MLDLAEQIARAVDDAVAPVTADEARARAGSRTHFRRTAVLATVVVVAIMGAGIVGALAALGVGRHSTTTVVETHSGSTTSLPAVVDVPTTVPIPLGDIAGRIDIPKINVHWPFLQGTSAADEAKGPIHDPATPMPGRPGNVVIAGHRTTHGAPFFNLGDLQPGDVIHLTTMGGAFTYVVDGSYVVSPEGDPIFPANIVDRIHDFRTTRALTVITNTPKFSAAMRLVVTAHDG